MRTRIGWLVAVALGLALAPAAAHAQTNQDYEVPPSPYIFPGPFGHPRMEEGGFFVGADMLWWTFTNPLRAQGVATRGCLRVRPSPGGAIAAGIRAAFTSMSPTYTWPAVSHAPRMREPEAAMDMLVIGHAPMVHG